ncbi:T9SS type A sorting domain-containing protein [Bacteroidota bacterium]
MRVRIILSLIAVFIFSQFTYSQFTDETIEWFTLGDGLSSTAHAVAVIGNDVYVGGSFVIAGGILVNRIAKWDGSSWSALGSGMNNDVQALAVIGNDLYAAGFFSTAGGVPVNNIAKWDGATWSTLGDGVNELVLCLATDGTDLYAGGFFTTAGGDSARMIAKWDGVSWSPLGSGINNEVNTVTVSGGNVYAGGIFTSAGGNPVSSLAKWDGVNWTDIGGGVNGYVKAISLIGNDIYVGGIFTSAGGSVPGWIARWDGSVWHALGDGVNGSVFSIEQSENDIYVGGMFTTAGNQPANRIAKFNVVNSTWSPIGDGTTGSVDAMTIQGSTNSMIIAGAFSHVGGSIPANYVARFTDSENPLPVELVSFTASQTEYDIKLDWSTSTETNNKGFEIFRSAHNDQIVWIKIGFVQGYGTTTELKHYSFTDDNLITGIYSYRLKQVDYDGTFSYSHIIEVDFTVAQGFALSQNYPNPFNSSTTIIYSLPSEGNVTLTVFDVSGREIETLVNKRQAAGSYKIDFDVPHLSTGIYYYRLSAGGLSQAKKLILLK